MFHYYLRYYNSAPGEGKRHCAATDRHTPATGQTGEGVRGLRTPLRHNCEEWHVRVLRLRGTHQSPALVSK